MHSMLVVSGLQKAYGQPVLTGIDITVKQGEFVGILGENGCGKSTLLEILAGSVKPDAGEIMLDSVDMLKNPGLFSEKMGYVPQENPIIEELSVLDNLSLWYRANALKEALASGPPAALGLLGALQQKAGRLSGGMKKRLSIACALAEHCSWLLLDEPSAALDIVCKRELHDYYKKYQQMGGTIIMTSHEEAEIQLFSRLYVMKQGKLLEIPTSLSIDNLAEQIREGK